MLDSREAGGPARAALLCLWDNSRICLGTRILLFRQLRALGTKDQMHLGLFVLLFWFVKLFWLIDKIAWTMRERYAKVKVYVKLTNGKCHFHFKIFLCMYRLYSLLSFKIDFVLIVIYLINEFYI